jgi:hypothetical protein
MDDLLAVDRVGMNEECRARIVAREQQQTNDGQYFTSCLLHSVCLFLECKDSVFNDFLQTPESRKKWSISQKKLPLARDSFCQNADRSTCSEIT